MPTLTLKDAIAAPGPGPAGLAWDGQIVWHSDFKEGLIYGLDKASGQVTRTLLCHGILSGLAWDGQSLWQSLYNEAMVRRIDPVSNDFDQHLILSEYGWLSGVAWDGHLLWVVAQQHGQLLGVDPILGTVQRTWSVPTVCGDIDYHGGKLWASIATPMSFDDMTGQFERETEDIHCAIIAIDPEKGQETERYPVDKFFTGLCWVADSLWLAQTFDRLIYRFNLT